MPNTHPHRTPHPSSPTHKIKIISIKCFSTFQPLLQTDGPMDGPMQWRAELVLVFCIPRQNTDMSIWVHWEKLLHTKKCFGNNPKFSEFSLPTVNMFGKLRASVKTTDYGRDEQKYQGSKWIDKQVTQFVDFKSIPFCRKKSPQIYFTS